MHRTASLNEESGRYSQLRGDFYLPDELREQSTKNRQATDDKGFNPTLFPEPQNPHTGVGNGWEGLATEHISTASYDAYASYEEMLNQNVAREQARILLPVNIYTSWVWKMDLHNLLHFLRLRLDPHAQYEIRVYAEAIAEFVKQLCPWTWEAFERYGLEGQYLSGPEWRAISSMLENGGYRMSSITDRLREEAAENGVEPHELHGMSKGEWREFCKKVDTL